MGGYALALAAGLPLLISPLVMVGGLRRIAAVLVSFTALPAIVLALVVEPGVTVYVPPILFGLTFGLDETARTFLLFTGILWSVAGIYACSYLSGGPAAHRFYLFFLLTMSGNLGLIVSEDVVGFYLFFTLMSFAAWGMVVHEWTERARRAARVYLVLVLIGEALLLPAVMLVVNAGAVRLAEAGPAIAGSPYRDLILALALAGFGVKAGALPLHVWLPLAYTAAPIPATAVLSGAMIKAGLLGWVYFLPTGESGLYAWGVLIAVLGVLAAFYGVLVGLFQQDPKTVLAYSSISQMGFMTVPVGVGLLAPEAWPAALTAISVYATHHALTKGSLFLGVGVAEKVGSRWQLWLVVAGFAVGALALAGAPLTSGAVAKETLKKAIEETSEPWPKVLEFSLDAAAVGTALIMARFVYVVWPGRPFEENSSAPAGLLDPWLGLVVGVAALGFLLPEPVTATLSLSSLVPVTVGSLITGVALFIARRYGWSLPGLPEGDILVPIVRVLEQTWSGLRTIRTPLVRLRDKLGSYLQDQTDHAGSFRTAAGSLENVLRRWPAATLLFVLLAAVLLAMTA